MTSLVLFVTAASAGKHGERKYTRPHLIYVAAALASCLDLNYCRDGVDYG